MKTLYLVRGVSGSGKSTFVDSIAGSLINMSGVGLGNNVGKASADRFFYDDDGNYNFDASKLGQAHESCFDSVSHMMDNQFTHIFVDNTFTRDREMNPYITLAKSKGYRVFTLIIENRHGGTNRHSVPEHVLDKQAQRFSIKLR